MIYIVTTVTTMKTSLMNALFVNSIDIIEITKQQLRVWKRSEYSGSFFVSRR